MEQRSSRWPRMVCTRIGSEPATNIMLQRYKRYVNIFLIYYRLQEMYTTIKLQILRLNFIAN